ncbi:MAG: hypothetical protein EOP50_09600 [Sphingobacteriales bacterium]|nr:MAG: hypothetical protein EOP50_09600 [Sphingobacteriales bacterium]
MPASQHIRDDAFLDRVISERFKGKYMSNTKWVQLLDKLIATQTRILQCRVKLIWESGPAYRELLLHSNLTYGFHYYQNAVEGLITGRPAGWYAYKEIEWIEFPLDTPGGPQDLEGIESVLRSVGQLELEKDADSIRVWAYR